MGGNRTLIVAAAVLIILAVLLGGGYMFMKSRGAAKTSEDASVTATPLSVTQIVVAVQDIQRGMTINIEKQDMVQLQDWPNDYLPIAYYTSLEEVDGKIARMEIPRGSPLFPDMLAGPGDMLSVGGSAAALFSYKDRVAYALPMDTQGGVAWAIRPGDRVDVVAAIKLTPIDAKYQSSQDVQFLALPQGDFSQLSGTFGDFETLPNGQPAIVFAPGAKIPQIVVQLTVQNAIVWHVGVWKQENESKPTPPPTEAPAAGGLGGQEATPPPATVPVTYGDVEPVTLLVSREDVLVLKYLTEMGADLDLVLRPAGYTAPVIQTQPVWLRYVVDKYQLPTEPSDLPVAPTAIRDTPLELTPATPPAEEQAK